MREEEEGEVAPTTVMTGASNTVTSSTKAPHSQTSAGAASTVVRSFILKPLYFWYRSPLKLFRPVRVDYLVMARAVTASPSTTALVPSKGRMGGQGGGRLRSRWEASSLGMIVAAVKQEGWYFFPRHILPPLLANSMCGAVLFNVYAALTPTPATFTDEEEGEERMGREEWMGGKEGGVQVTQPPPIWRYYAAGAVAGSCHALVAAPMDALQVRMEVKELLDRKHPGIWRWAVKSLRDMGFLQAYRGFTLTCSKVSAGKGSPEASQPPRSLLPLFSYSSPSPLSRMSWVTVSFSGCMKVPGPHC